MPIQGRKKSLLFCEQKRSKKNFDLFDVSPLVPHPPEGEQKFFWFFFFKKRTSFLLLFLVFLTRWPILHRTVLDWDESLYALMAQQWRLGHLPYTTIWDNKPVGIYAIFALFQMIAPVVLAMRLATVVCVSVLAITVQRITWQLTGQAAASLAAGLVVVVASLSNDGLSANTELFMAMFTALAVLAALADRPGLAGLCLGAAFMIKYVMLFEAGAVMFLILRRGGWRAAGWAVLGGAVPLLAVVALYAQSGQLGLWWACSVASNFTRADAPVTAGALIYACHTEAWRWGPLFLALPVLAWHRERVFLYLWLLGGCLGVAAAKSFYDHYFLQILPVLAVASGVLLARLPRGRVLVALVLISLPTTAGVAALREAMLPDVPAEIAAVLPKGSLYVFDSQPILYALTGAPLPTRYLLPSVLTGTLLPRVAGIDAVAEVNRILATRPQFIIKRTPPPALPPPVYGVVDQALAAHYHLWRHFTVTDVYQLN
jgi:4-amino-4-deoxy-L-arabinose transferase-like glycosyltransferase